MLEPVTQVSVNPSEDGQGRLYRLVTEPVKEGREQQLNELIQKISPGARKMVVIPRKDSQYYFDFEHYPGEEYVLINDISNDREVMVINPPALSRSVLIGIEEDLDPDKVKFSGSDWMEITVSAFARGEISYTYDENAKKDVRAPQPCYNPLT